MRNFRVILILSFHLFFVNTAFLSRFLPPDNQLSYECNPQCETCDSLDTSKCLSCQSDKNRILQPNSKCACKQNYYEEYSTCHRCQSDCILTYCTESPECFNPNPKSELRDDVESISSPSDNITFLQHHLNESQPILDFTYQFQRIIFSNTDDSREITISLTLIFNHELKQFIDNPSNLFTISLEYLPLTNTARESKNISGIIILLLPEESMQGQSGTTYNLILRIIYPIAEQLPSHRSSLIQITVKPNPSQLNIEHIFHPVTQRLLLSCRTINHDNQNNKNNAITTTQRSSITPNKTKARFLIIPVRRIRLLASASFDTSNYSGITEMRDVSEFLFSEQAVSEWLYTTLTILRYLAIFTHLLPCIQFTVALTFMNTFRPPIFYYYLRLFAGFSVVSAPEWQPNSYTDSRETTFQLNNTFFVSLVGQLAIALLIYKILISLKSNNENRSLTIKKAQQFSIELVHKSHSAVEFNIIYYSISLLQTADDTTSLGIVYLCVGLITLVFIAAFDGLGIKQIFEQNYTFYHPFTKDLIIEQKQSRMYRILIGTVKKQSQVVLICVFYGISNPVLLLIILLSLNSLGLLSTIIIRPYKVKPLFIFRVLEEIACVAIFSLLLATQMMFNSDSSETNAISNVDSYYSIDITCCVLISIFLLVNILRIIFNLWVFVRERRNNPGARSKEGIRSNLIESKEFQGINSNYSSAQNLKNFNSSKSTSSGNKNGGTSSTTRVGSATKGRGLKANRQGNVNPVVMELIGKEKFESRLENPMLRLRKFRQGDGFLRNPQMPCDFNQEKERHARFQIDIDTQTEHDQDHGGRVEKRRKIPSNLIKHQQNDKPKKELECDNYVSNKFNPIERNSIDY